MGSLTSIMQEKNISRKSKIRMYETIIRPVVTYASETWTLNKQDEMKLETWERKILRKIFGGVKSTEGEWRRRTNQEVMNLYRRPRITQKIRAQRIRWLGHITRMPGQRIAKRVLEEGRGEKRRRGRPRKKWLEEVQKDLKANGVKNWKSVVTDRRDGNK